MELSQAEADEEVGHHRLANVGRIEEAAQKRIGQAQADDARQQLRARDIPFCFLTNNSQRTRRDVVARLARMGIEVEERHVFTCAMATAISL